MIVDDEEAEAPVLVDPGQLVGGGRVLGLGDNLWSKRYSNVMLGRSILPVIKQTLSPRTRLFSRLAL